MEIKCACCGELIVAEYHTFPPDGDNPYYCSEKCYGNRKEGDKN